MTIATLPMQILIGGLHAMVFVGAYLYFMRGGFGKVKKNKIKARDINVKFSDVIGLDGAKKEAMEVFQLIKDSAKVKKIGGKIVKGIILMGPPGCGKTLLAKAIATEAKMPFLSMSGSEFVEVFVGVGASRVRQLFQKARKLAYAEGACILFIDEIEVIGRGRTFSGFPAAISAADRRPTARPRSAGCRSRPRGRSGCRAANGTRAPRRPPPDARRRICPRPGRRAAGCSACGPWTR